MIKTNSNPSLSDLAEIAINATRNSYSPYSGFRVGAALLCSDGTVYMGCNIENSSYSATVCAERVAFQKAVSQGKKDFVSITVVGSNDDNFKSPCYPCGVCRQVMAEFCNNNEFEIILPYNKNNEMEFEIYKLSDLLPNSFSL